MDARTMDDTPTIRRSSRPAAVPMYVPEHLDVTPLPLPPPSRQRETTRRPDPESDNLTAVLGAILEQLTTPPKTTGQKIRDWFTAPANWIVLGAAIWGVLSAGLQVRDQWRETVSFRKVAVRAHEDIAESLSTLRDEVIEMRGKDKARNGG